MPVIAAAVVAPIVVPLIVPPVIVTELAFCDAIVPNPVISELGIDDTVVNAVVPLAFKYPAVNVAAPLPPLATPSVPVTPVDNGRPVALVSVPLDGVPSAPPLTTNAPAEPVLTASAVATPVPNPLIPVDTGRPVALVSVTDVGVPRIGVTNVGLVANTNEPEPVSSVIAAANYKKIS